jgi:hypothetical protein
VSRAGTGTDCLDTGKCGVATQYTTQLPNVKANDMEQERKLICIYQDVNYKKSRQRRPNNRFQICADLTTMPIPLLILLAELRLSGCLDQNGWPNPKKVCLTENLLEKWRTQVSEVRP